MTTTPADGATAERGRVNIAFTKDVEPMARQLMSTFQLASLLDVARLGIAYAVRTGLSLSRPAGFGADSGANYNIGSLDPQQELRDMLTALHPYMTEDPYRVMQTLMNMGTAKLGDDVNAGRIHSLSDLLGDDWSE